jgi:hypothetical protein
MKSLISSKQSQTEQKMAVSALSFAFSSLSPQKSSLCSFPEKSQVFKSSNPVTYFSFFILWLSVLIFFFFQVVSKLQKNSSRGRRVWRRRKLVFTIIFPFLPFLNETLVGISWNVNTETISWWDILKILNIFQIILNPYQEVLKCEHWINFFMRRNLEKWLTFSMRIMKCLLVCLFGFFFSCLLISAVVFVAIP